MREPAAAPLQPTSPVACPRCPREDDGLAIPVATFTAAGELAAHLIDTHHLSPSVALRDARTAFPRAEAAARLHPAPAPAQAPVTPAERAVLAQRLGVKPSHPVVADVLKRAGVVEAPQEVVPMAKKKTTRRPVICRTCGRTGHFAKTCPGTPAPAAAPPRGRGARPAPVVQGGGVVQAIRLEITQYEGKIAALKQALAVLGGG